MTDPAENLAVRVRGVIDQLELIVDRALPWDTGSREEGQPYDFRPFMHNFNPHNMLTMLAAHKEILATVADIATPDYRTAAEAVSYHVLRRLAEGYGIEVDQ